MNRGRDGVVMEIGIFSKSWVVDRGLWDEWEVICYKVKG